MGPTVGVIHGEGLWAAGRPGEALEMLAATAETAERGHVGVLLPEVYRLMGELVSRGAAIVMISSELPEILGMSDRILVMRDGRICGEFDRAGATEENILNCALRGAA